MLSSQIGREIKSRRAALQIGQEALCAKARVSRAVLSKLENQRGEPVQTDVIDRLLAGLDAKVTVSLGESAASSRAEERLRNRLRHEELRQHHLRVALDLCANQADATPKIARALRQVDLWEQRKACSPRYIEGWRKALSLDPRGVALAMTSFGDWENAMYQNSPWSFLWT
jgi:transcriptional regulator with XRE-family HTH domain